MGKIILVTGGARSGKSTFAERYANQYGQRIAYIATAQVYDEEMAYRVKLHQERRPAVWDTYEAPQDAGKVLSMAGKQHDFILFDCLTIYLSNLLCAMDTLELPVLQTQVRGQIDQLLAAAAAQEATTLFVTNEVGAGIVPENSLARAYRDMAGWMNQWVAERAAQVYLVVCGLPVDIKKAAAALEV